MTYAYNCYGKCLARCGWIYKVTRAYEERKKEKKNLNVNVLGLLPTNLYGQFWSKDILLREGHISHNACENLLNLNKKNQEIMSQVMYL